MSQQTQLSLKIQNFKQFKLSTQKLFVLYTLPMQDLSAAELNLNAS